MLSNGIFPLFHVLFFILFLGVLYGMLRSAGDGAGGMGAALSGAALAGGIVFVTLSAAGFTAEILYPAVLQRFGDIQPDAAFVLASLTLSSWLYHFCQIGTSAMALSTSLVAVGTGVLPGWLALAGLVVALVTFLHFLLPLLAALVGMGGSGLDSDAYRWRSPTFPDKAHPLKRSEEILTSSDRAISISAGQHFSKNKKLKC